MHPHNATSILTKNLLHHRTGRISAHPAPTVLQHSRTEQKQIIVDDPYCHGTTSCSTCESQPTILDSDFIYPPLHAYISLMLLMNNAKNDTQLWKITTDDKHPSCTFVPPSDLTITMDAMSTTSSVEILWDKLNNYLTLYDIWLTQRQDEFVLSSKALTTNDPSKILKTLNLPAAQHPDISLLTILQSSDVQPYISTTIQTTVYQHTPTQEVPYQFRLVFKDYAFECNANTSTYSLATIALTSPPGLTLIAEILTAILRYLQWNQELIYSTPLDPLIQCIKTASPIHYYQLLDKNIINDIIAADTKEGQGMSLDQDETLNLEKWMTHLHGGRSLHMGARRMYVKACSLFPGHQLPLQYFADYVAARATWQKQR